MTVRLLLLDDRAAAPQALRSALAVHAPQWVLQVVSTPEEAQALVPQAPVDVVLIALAQHPEWGDGLAAQWQGLPVCLWVPPDLPAHRALHPAAVCSVLEDGSDEGMQRLVQSLRACAIGQYTPGDVEHIRKILLPLLDCIAQGIAYVDAKGRVRLYNQRMLDLLELPASLMAGGPTMDEVLDWQRERGEFSEANVSYDTVARGYLHACMDGVAVRREAPERYLRRTGQGLVLEISTHMLPQGGMVRTYTDVTDYVQAQEALRQSEVRWRQLTHLSSDWFWEQDTEFRFVHFEGRAQDCLALSHTGHLGLRRWELPDASATPAQWQSHQAALQAHEPFHNFEVQRLASDGRLLWVSVSGEPIFDAAGQFTGYRGIARDITQQKQAEAEIQRLAYFDELTRLPNRRMLAERLEQALALSRRAQGHGALLYLDLDDFKQVNDTLGHEWGDVLLRQAGERLGECIRATDTVARLGGDEFVLVLQGLDANGECAATQAEAVAHKIQACLSQPYHLAGADMHAPPSIGMVLFCDARHTVPELMQRADMAMYQAKAEGLHQPCFFDPAMQAQAAARSTLEADVRLGLLRNEFTLFFQPVVNHEGKTQGVEALARWQHPQRGWVLPGEFIDLCERSGLILSLGRQVLQAACEQLARWAQDPLRAPWTVSVNVSAREFRHPGFVEQVLHTLRQTGADPSLLRLELTESILLTDVEDSIAKMQALRQQGVTFSLDDFGTGYSSLSYLKRLPIDQLKIDQSFVRDLLTDPNDAAIACTVIALGRSLGLEVVAEGVETHAQRKFLLRNGCQRFQGYLFGQPVLADALAG